MGKIYPRKAAPVIWCGLSILLITSSRPSFCQEEIQFSSISSFGGVGLIEIPSARMANDGELSFSVGRAFPYLKNAVTIQPLPWLEGVLRYTTIQNRDYGPTWFSGDQKYKDRSFDFKIPIIKESKYSPAVSLGMRDFLGTGLFSSEYIVASRRYYNFDFTLGLGWGNLGTKGQIKNPFSYISKGFSNRNTTGSQAGQFSFQYFRGERASIFGGIEYITPVPGMRIKLELDGNNYQHEYQSNNQPVSSPFNIGITYDIEKWLSLSVAVERGNTLFAQATFSSNLNDTRGMPKFDPPPPKVKPRDLSSEFTTSNIQSVSPQAESNDENLRLRLTQALENQGFVVNGLKIEKKRISANLSQGVYRHLARAVGRASRAIATEAPPEVNQITYVHTVDGIENSQVTVFRDDITRGSNYEVSPEEIIHRTTIQPVSAADRNSIPKQPGRYPAASWAWAPAMRHHIGGPDNPYFFQLYLKLDGVLEITPKLSITGTYAADIFNNLNELKQVSNSTLPHVRSDIKDYLKEGKTGINRLEIDYVTEIGQNWYGRFSAGLLEEMFGGISSELLYRPFDSRWAIGADINSVRQRDYDQRFGFKDYKVTTGHIDYYTQLPFYNMGAQISVGKYLAGDKGATLTLAKSFQSGAIFGGFVTLTNVSAAQFGEGSFDKGIFISVPLDLISLYSSRGAIGSMWRPLTRDGGQRLAVGKRLYSIAGDANKQSVTYDWHKIFD